MLNSQTRGNTTPEIQTIAFDINLRNEKWLFAGSYRLE